MINPNFPLVLSDLDQSELLRKMIFNINLLDSNYQLSELSKATLDYNFTANNYRLYESNGLERKTLAQAVSTVRATTATVQQPYGISSSTINTPRISYDTMAQPLGLLVEAASTNMLLHSSDYTNAAWTKFMLTANASSVVAPDGVSSVSFLAETTTLQQHVVSQNFTPLSSTVAVSCYIKGEGRDNFYFRLDDGGSVNVRIYHINLVNVTVTELNLGGTSTLTSSNAFIERCPNGWFRVGFSANFSVVPASARFRVYPIRPELSRVDVYEGDITKGFYLFGCQAENNSLVTSLIPTTTASVTRAAETLSTVVPNSFEGTIYVVASGNLPVSGVNQAIFTLSDGTTNNRVSVRRNNSDVGTNYIVVSGGVVQMSTNSNIPKTKAQRNKYAISWKNGSIVAVEDGKTILSLQTGNAPTGLTQLYVGSNATGTSEHLNGNIERLVFIPRALNETDLQYITTNA